MSVLFKVDFKMFRSILLGYKVQLSFLIHLVPLTMIYMMAVPYRDAESNKKSSVTINTTNSVKDQVLGVLKLLYKMLPAHSYFINPFGPVLRKFPSSKKQNYDGIIVQDFNFKQIFECLLKRLI